VLCTNIIRTITLGGGGYVIRVEEIEKSKRKSDSKNLEGRKTRHKWEDGIKTEVGCEDVD
jgi:hypothetical protein